MEKNTLSQILYLVGAIIVIMGIVILVGQHWQGIGPATRVLVTLGMAIALYISGVLLGQRTEATPEATKNIGRLSAILHVLGAILLPLGLGVLFDAVGFRVNDAGIKSLIFGISFVTYLASVWTFKKEQFVFFSAIFGTGFFYTFAAFILAGQVAVWTDLGKYILLTIGASHLLIAYALAGQYSKTSRLLTHTGLLAFFAAALVLTGWKPSQSAFWEIVYPALVFGGLFLSVSFKDKAYLGWSSIFLIAYIAKITSEYFYESLGWPLSLVFAGFMLIGLGWLVLWINRRFFGKVEVAKVANAVDVA